MLILQSNQEAAFTRRPFPQAPKDPSSPSFCPSLSFLLPLHNLEIKEKDPPPPPLSWGHSGDPAEEQPASNSDRPRRLVIREAQCDVALGSSVWFRESWQIWWLVSPRVSLSYRPDSHGGSLLTGALGYSGCGRLVPSITYTPQASFN